MNALQSVALRGQEIGTRAVDLTVGAVAQTGERVSAAVKPVTSATERNKLGRSLRTSVRGAQRRGARVRKDAERTARTRRRNTERQVTKARRDVERQVKKARTDTQRRVRGARRDAEQRVKSLRS
ncbi:MAG: hypothetical protein ACR2OC_01135 [Solirubrobacterales bacterium]